MAVARSERTEGPSAGQHLSPRSARPAESEGGLRFTFPTPGALNLTLAVTGLAAASVNPFPASESDGTLAVGIGAENQAKPSIFGRLLIIANMSFPGSFSGLFPTLTAILTPLPASDSDGSGTVGFSAKK